MTDQLRTLAEAKSQIAFPVPELHMLKEIRKERRIGYVEGFIAGRTSVTRESIAEIIYANTEQVDYCGYGLLVVDDPLELADAILALLKGRER